MTTLTKQACDDFAARARTLANQATTEAARAIHVQIARDYEAKATSLAVVGSYPMSDHTSCLSDAGCSRFQPMSEKSIAGTGIGAAPEGHLGDGITASAPASTGGSKLAIVLNTAAVIIFTIIFAGGLSVPREAFSSALYAILPQPGAKPVGAPAAKRTNLKKGEPNRTASDGDLVFQKRPGR